MIEYLQIEINNINNFNNIGDLNDILKECVNLNEMRAIVYIYDYIKLHKLIPTDYTYELINKMHSKTIKENNNLIIPDNNINNLQPRRRIHKIMKGYNYSNALKNKDIIINYLNNNNYEYDGKNNKLKNKLINEIYSNSTVSISDIKHIITYLNRQKYFIKN